MRLPLTASRYVAVTALGGLLLVLATLLALYSLIDVLRELRQVGGDYNLAAVLLYVLKTLPRRVYEIFPFAALIGTLLGLGSLASTQELTALRAGGISRQTVAFMSLLGGLALLAIIMLMAETVMPELETQARADREQARRGEVDLGRGDGLWLRDGAALVRIGQPVWKSDAEMEFADISLYELESGFMPQRLIQARRASHQPGEWLLEAVTVQELAMGSVSAVARYDTLTYASRLDPDLFDAAVSRPKFLAARDLARLSAYLQANNLDDSAYRAAYWARIFYPLGVLAMMMIGLPFVFQPTRDRGWGLRVLTGIGLGVGFFVLNRSLQGVVVLLDVPYWLSSAIAPVGFIAAALLLLRRHR